MAERTVLQSMSRRHVLSLGPGASVHDAACVMTHANCGSVLIIDAAGTMLGILTERDLMTRVLANGLDPLATTVSKVMTRKPAVHDARDQGRRRRARDDRARLPPPARRRVGRPHHRRVLPRAMPCQRELDTAVDPRGVQRAG